MLDTLLDNENKPPFWWLALFSGLVAWAFACVCLFLALKFRLAPSPGSEADLGVGLLAYYGWPFPAAVAFLGAARSVPARWKLALAAPCAILLVAFLIVSFGVTARP